MKNVMKEIVKPIAVLTCICLVVAALLAFVNQLTSPIITAAEEKAAAEARTEVLSEAKRFQEVPYDQWPEGVAEVYRGNDDSGYVIVVQTKGYGGVMTVICGIRPDGTLEAAKTLFHSETNGVGTKAVDNHSGYRERFAGQTAEGCQQVDTISGATISSTAFKKAIGLAFEAYGIVKEAGL